MTQPKRGNWDTVTHDSDLRHKIDCCSTSGGHLCYTRVFFCDVKFLTIQASVPGFSGGLCVLCTTQSVCVCMHGILMSAWLIDVWMEIVFPDDLYKQMVKLMNTQTGIDPETRAWLLQIFLCGKASSTLQQMSGGWSYFNKFNTLRLWKTKNWVKRVCVNYKERQAEREQSITNCCLAGPPLKITRWVHLLGCANRNRAGWREHNIDAVPSQQRRPLCLQRQRKVHIHSTFASETLKKQYFLFMLGIE